MLHHRIGRLSGTALETPLHEPEVVHVRLEAPLNRNGVAFGLEHLDRSLMERSNAREPSRFLVVLPAALHLRPEERAEKEERRNLFADRQPLIRAL